MNKNDTRLSASGITALNSLKTFGFIARKVITAFVESWFEARQISHPKDLYSLSQQVLRKYRSRILLYLISAIVKSSFAYLTLVSAYSKSLTISQRQVDTWHEYGDIDCRIYFHLLFVVVTEALNGFWNFIKLKYLIDALWRISGWRRQGRSPYRLTITIIWNTC